MYTPPREPCRAKMPHKESTKRQERGANNRRGRPDNGFSLLFGRRAVPTRGYDAIHTAAASVTDARGMEANKHVVNFKHVRYACEGGSVDSDLRLPVKL